MGSHARVWPAEPSSRESKTGRVWELADELSARLGRRVDRKAVIDAYVAEGGNQNTASTQYFYWKQAFDARRAPARERFRSVSPKRLTVGRDGRLAIPPDMRTAMLLDDDDAVTAEVVDGELRVLSAKAAVRHVQALARKLDKGRGSIVDELIADRREEARRENGDGT